MIVIPPITINDTTLTSSNVPETDYAQWVDTTSYSIGDRVIVLATHKIYEAQVANLDKYPPDHLDDGDPDADPVVLDTWLEVSATNRYKMFDGDPTSETIKSTSIIVEITPGVIYNAICIFGLSAETLNVTVTDPTDGVVFNRDYDLNEYAEIIDFYEWFFYPIIKKNLVVDLSLPAYLDSTVKITATSSSTVKIGELVTGLQRPIGEATYGSAVGFNDSSVKEEGYIEAGRSFKFVDYEVNLYTHTVYTVRRLLESIRAIPAVYIGNANEPSSVILGFFRDFDATLVSKTRSTYSLEVEEL